MSHHETTGRNVAMIGNTAKTKAAGIGVKDGIPPLRRD